MKTMKINKVEISKIYFITCKKISNDNFKYIN